MWVYPLRRKDEVFSKYLELSNYVEKHFKTTIKSLQCDNGTEYNNSQFHSLFASKATYFWFSCPYTSQQNGRSERMICTINNAVHSLLFEAQLPPSFWIEALHTAVHVLNLLPSKAITNKIPFTTLFKKPVSYSHFRIFGCLCTRTKTTPPHQNFHLILQDAHLLAILNFIEDTCLWFKYQKDHHLLSSYVWWVVLSLQRSKVSSRLHIWVFGATFWSFSSLQKYLTKLHCEHSSSSGCPGWCASANSDCSWGS